MFQLICVTFPGRQNLSSLVNHYHTQLIIPSSCESFTMCVSSSVPPPSLMPLVLLHHILVDTRWPRGDKACLSCAHQPARKQRCRKRAICHRPTKQMIKLAISALHPPPRYEQTDTHGNSQTHTGHSLFQVLARVCVSLCVCVRTKRGNDHLTLTPVLPRGGHRKHKRERVQG